MMPQRQGEFWQLPKMHCELPMHSPSGSPHSMALQLPGPLMLKKPHDWHFPVQDVSQQKPSTQKPL